MNIKFKLKIVNNLYCIVFRIVHTVYKFEQYSLNIVISLYIIIWYGGIGQSRFICQVLCSGMQVISALVLGGSSAEEGSSAKFGIAVFKASILDYVGVHWLK